MSDLAVPEVPLAARRLPVFVYDDQVIQQWERLITLDKREARRGRWILRGLAGFTVVSVLLNLLLAGGLNYALPLLRILPVFFWQQPDGSIQTAITTDSLPGLMADVGVKAVLWQYVRYRESYSYTELDFAHHFVEALSVDAVREPYDKWVSGKNPNSYQRIYGRKSIIRVDRPLNVTDWRPAFPGQPGRITFDYHRCIYTETDARLPTTAECPVWRVHLEFVQDYSAQVDWAAVFMTNNPTRVYVTGYPGPVPLAPEELSPR